MAQIVPPRAVRVAFAHFDTLNPLIELAGYADDYRKGVIEKIAALRR